MSDNIILRFNRDGRIDHRNGNHSFWDEEKKTPMTDVGVNSFSDTFKQFYKVMKTEVEYDAEDSDMINVIYFDEGGYADFLMKTT